MGKKQHQSDKLYLTTTEWKNLYGGHKDRRALDNIRANFRRLPFDHCSLSLQPFEHPLCDLEGHIFDITVIVPYLKKFGRNPVTGKKLDAKSLIHLNFHKTDQGKYHCPVTFKEFTNASHIMAVKNTGNVYAHEAIETLNAKPKYWKDLLTDEPFTRADLLTIQDPDNLQKFNIAEFYHVLHDEKVVDLGELKAQKEDPTYTIRQVNNETKETLKQLKTDFKGDPYLMKITKSAMPKLGNEGAVADAVNAAHYSTGQVAASFTSTVMPQVMVQEAAIVDEEFLRFARVKKKGYVRLITNYGDLNLELHCDRIPKACENFIKLCAKGYYNNTKFHRSIRHFMVQGGDPTGTGMGGESIYGKPFEDDFKVNLTHSGRGILSYANSGKNTNKSQFFITYRSCRHLDNKHTVFGKLVGGMDTLNKIEEVPTGEKDRPLKDIKILNVQVFVDPYEEAETQLANERASALDKEKEESEKKKAEMKKAEARKVYRSGVGKYIKPTVMKRQSQAVSDNESRKSKQLKSSLNDFSSW